MEKVENKEVEQYIKNTISSMIDSNKLFEKVYGKNFAKRRLAQNLKKVYTNLYEIGRLGFYHNINKSITICTKNRDDDSVLTVEDIESNNNLLFVIIHESVHATLKRTLPERLKYGIGNVSTGLLEEISKGKRLGIGLNEGLTNWISTKVSGLDHTSYNELTTLIKELEIAIGEENVMKLGKGNIKKNVVNILQMKPKELVTFLAKGDSLFLFGEQIWQLYEINFVLEECLYANLSEQEIEGKIKKLKADCPVYDKQNMDDIPTLAERKQKIDEILNSSAESRDALTTDLENTIYEKYLQKDFERMSIEGNISDGDFKKFRDLKSLIMTRIDSSQESEQNEQSSIITFLKQFPDFEKKYMEEVSKITQEELAKGTFSLEKFRSKIEALNYKNDNMTGIESSFLDKYIKQVALGLGGKNTKQTEILLDYLVRTNNLEDNDISQFSITTATYNGKTIPIILKDGVPVSRKGDYFENKHTASDKISDKFEDEFEFTLETDEDSQNIIKEFNQLVSQVKLGCPNAQITILDREIYIQTDTELSLLVIDKGEILPTKLSKDKPYKMEFQEEKNSLIPVKQNKPTRFSKITSRLKQLFSRKSDLKIAQITPLVQEPKLQYIKNAQNQFRESLKYNVDYNKEDNSYQQDSKFIKSQDEER